MYKFIYNFQIKYINLIIIIGKHEGGLITAIRNSTDNTMDNTMTITKKQKWEGKQLCGRFKRLINNISHQKTRMWLRKGNFKRETEFLRIVAQNNAIRTNQIKARIDKTQQNSKCSLCGDRDETINHMISECSKLAQKEYKTRHDWVGQMIHCEMCKKFKFDHTNKWYMHNSASVQENDMHEQLWDFDIHTDHLISAKRSDLIIINMKVTIIPIVIGAFDTITKGLFNGLEDSEVGGRMETIQTRALSRTARILRRVLKT